MYFDPFIKISGDNVSEIGFTEQAPTSTPSAGSTISMSSSADATSAITSIDTAIDTIANTRSAMAVSENSIDHKINNLTNLNIITKNNLSKIEDVDIALESAKLTKSQIINQVATAILAQANASSNIFLKLLQ